MTPDYVIKNLRASTGTCTLIHAVTSLYLLAFATVLWTVQFSFAAIALSLGYPSQTRYFHESFGSPWLYAFIFLLWIGFTMVFEKLYRTGTFTTNAARGLRFDDNDGLLKNLYLTWFRHDLLPVLSVPLGLIFAPASAFLAGVKISFQAQPLSRTLLRDMADIIVRLREWPDGMSLELFHGIYPGRKFRRALRRLRSLAMVNITPMEPHDILVNRQILARWASGAIFIPPLNPVSQAFTANFITLNNHSRTQHWKVVWEIILTMVLRITLGCLAAAIPVGLLFWTLPAHPAKTTLLAGILALGGLIYVLTPDRIRNL